MVRVQIGCLELEKWRLQGQRKRMGTRNVLHTPSDAASILPTEELSRRIFLLRMVCWPSKVKQLIQHHTAKN